MAINEEQLISWSKPVSSTEDQKCQNAIIKVTEAIRAKFNSSVSIFLQGSYRNNTNVKKDSDVDIVVRHDGYYYYDLQRLSESDKLQYEKTKSPGNYPFIQLKSDVLQALTTAFNNDAKPRNKCIEVTGNSNRITADVIPCFQHKRYITLTAVEAEGIQFYTDQLEKIISFPNQHYENGVAKTNNTGRMYKRTVRILKVLRNMLIAEGKITENLVSSFFIECLVYNVPNISFMTGEYKQTLKNVISKIQTDMETSSTAEKYVEVSGLKWLFGENPKRPPSNASEFVNKCWRVAEF